MIEIGYKEALDSPARAAEKVAEFLGRRFDIARMAETVDLTLYRNRKGG